MTNIEGINSLVAGLSLNSKITILNDSCNIKLVI